MDIFRVRRGGPVWRVGCGGAAPAPTITPSQTTKRKTVFKNMIVHCPRLADLRAGGRGPGQAPFMECRATRKNHWAGVPPRGEQHGPALAESVGRQWILRFMVESKIAARLGAQPPREGKATFCPSSRKPVPNPARRKAKELQGKAKLTLAVQRLSPNGQHGCGLTPNRACWCWTPPQGCADEVVSLLVESCQACRYHSSARRPAPGSMAHWLATQDRRGLQH